MSISAVSGRQAPQFTRAQLIGLVVAAIGFAVPWLVEVPGLSPAGHRMFAIFIMAIVLWVTEAVPMHATAVIILLLEVLLLSDRALLALPEGFAGIRYQGVFAALADPIIILFLGGFFLADCATKYELDRNLSRVILRPFGTHPRMVLLGLMLVTGIFSMFMSNTATTATMMTLALPVIAQFPPTDRMRAAIALSIPMAANIGGIGTPIGTPPNAIALGALAASGVTGIPTFLQWMMGAIPFMVVFLLMAWGLLVLFFPTRQAAVELPRSARFDRSVPAMIFYVTFLLTVGLWLTENLHGISSNIVGFVPVVILLSTRVFSVKDMKSLDWHVLWLVAGGIALGLGVGQTGMDSWFIGLFDWQRMSPAMLIAVLAGASLIMGTFISHSATANLLVPIGISMARSPELGDVISPVAAAVFIAIGSSLAMALPISTPPNAIAFSTGEVRSKDMAVVGAVIGVIGWAIFVTVGPWMWQALGILPPASP
jgi:solute carrier family 13 (sodium-dependent dicarboxylate transporter), member 2/3/5